MTRAHREIADMKSSVVISDYDPQWTNIYAAERTKILSVIGPKTVAIQHIGSTAVPGLAAKPIIDIMVAIRDLAGAHGCVEPLKRIGYEYVPEYEASMPERRYFRKGPSNVPNQHLHLHMVEITSKFWSRHLQFRDYLRDHPEKATEYLKLKKELAAKHGSDREAYTEGKTSFIESVVSLALAEKTQHYHKQHRVRTSKCRDAHAFSNSNKPAEAAKPQP